MNGSLRSRLMGAFPFGGGTLLLAAVLVMVNPGNIIPEGIIPGVGSPPPSEWCEVTYFALNPDDNNQPNPDKEVPAAFGPAVTVRGEAEVKAELDKRRDCGEDGEFDPALTASHYSAWSDAGLTKYSVPYAEIDAFYAKISVDPALYNEVLTELKDLENASAYSEEAVPKGIWSLFMDPNGSGGVSVKQGVTSADGTNAVFTHPSGATIKYRLDCGFQVNRDSEFPGVPHCTPETCPPPAPPTPPAPPAPPHEPEEPVKHEEKWVKETTYESGWDQRGTDNHVTDGNQSRNQIQSGDSRGNAVNDQVPNSSKTISGGTTPDLVPSNQGGAVSEGASEGGGNQSEGVVQEHSNQDDGGTNGDTEISDPG